MVALFDTHAIGWVAPRPLWTRIGDLAGSGPARDAFVRPAILRFATDSFMEEFTALLRLYPEHLDEWQARPETWERPSPAPSVAHRLEVQAPRSDMATRLTREARARRPATRALVPAPAAPLKLFQPVHKRFYLVAASLVCQRPGLPDRGLEAARADSVGFVLRRLLPAEGDPADDPSKWTEHAFLPAADAGRWVPVPDKSSEPVPGEERLGMFPMPVELRPGARHRIHSGLIPVSRRDAYVQAPIGGPVPEAPALDGGPEDLPSPPRPDTRMLLFRMQVSGPWDTLARQAVSEIARYEQSRSGNDPVADQVGTPPTGPDAGIVRRSRDQIQTASWLILADFVRFLDTHVPAVAAVLRGDAPDSSLDATTEAPLLARLRQTRLEASIASLVSGSAYDPGDVLDTLAEALERFARDPGLLAAIEAEEEAFDRATPSENWPDFLFPLAEVAPDARAAFVPGSTSAVPFRVAGDDFSGGAPRDTQIARIDLMLGELEALVSAALPDADEAPMPEIAPPPPAITATNPREAWFTIRCVYERPNCGPRAATVISAPTDPFRMASFFDADAPGRPIRIQMPLDVTPAALRRFNRSAGFVLSDALCGKVTGMRRMTLGDLVRSVLPWPLHKDLPDPGPSKCTDGGSGASIGMFCSLSIPIVTIVAMILMIIIVTLFDIVFRWLPYLFMCLPIPGLKGKQS